MMASLTKMLSLRIVQFQELKVSRRRTGLLGVFPPCYQPDKDYVDSDGDSNDDALIPAANLGRLS